MDAILHSTTHRDTMDNPHPRNGTGNKTARPQVSRRILLHYSQKKLTLIRNTHNNNNNNNNKTHKRQLYIAKNIHNKLSKNKAIITRADKGKTTVIIYEHEYHKKIRAFLSENNIEPILTDPTNKYQTHITKKLKQCDLIFPKKQHTHITEGTPPHPH